MQNQPWMRPALQRSEAVLMPALPRRNAPGVRLRFPQVNVTEDTFRPVPAQDEQRPMELSTYVRARGSMAGRGVLRAVGVHTTPMGASGRPAYAGRYSCLLRRVRGK